MKLAPEDVTPDYIVEQFRCLYFRHMDADLFPKGKGDWIDTSKPKIKYRARNRNYLSQPPVIPKPFIEFACPAPELASE